MIVQEDLIKKLFNKFVKPYIELSFIRCSKHTLTKLEDY